MEMKDFNSHNIGEVNLSYGYEKMNSTALTVKEDMNSEVSSEVNVCRPTPENDIDTELMNLNETVPYSVQDNGQLSINGSETPFCFVGIKMESPDDSEGEASSANSESKYTSVKYPSNHERQSSFGDYQYLEKFSSKLSDMSHVEIKMEYEEVDSCKSNNMSVPIDMNKKCDSISMLHRCDVGHSSSEFIRGIDCQEYPMLRVKEEDRENTIMQIAPNSRNSMQIKEEKNQEDLISSDVEYNHEKLSYNSVYQNYKGNVIERKKIPTESLMKMERQEVSFRELNCPSTGNMYINETLGYYSGSSIHPVDSDKNNSCCEKLQCGNKEIQADAARSIVQMNPNMTIDESGINDHNEDHNVARMDNMGIQFQSICDVSEFDIKAEKTFLSDADSENDGDFEDKLPIFKPQSVNLKGETLELDDACENKVTKNSSHEVNSSRSVLMEARVERENLSLLGLCPSPLTETGNKAYEIKNLQKLPRKKILSLENLE